MAHGAKRSEFSPYALYSALRALRYALRYYQDPSMTKLLASLRGQRIVVTGASGFFGSHLCPRLRNEGAEIYAVSRSAHEDAGPGLHWLQADLTDTAAIRRMLLEVKPDVVYHLSGLATGVCGLEVVLPTLSSLLVSTVNLLTVAAEIGSARIVLAGSLTEPLPHDVEPTPGSPYAAAKWASSAYGRMFRRLYALPVVNLRVFMAYGPAQDNRKLIPYVTGALLKQQSPDLSNGNWQADWIYIDDVISGLVAAARIRNVPEGTIDLGSGSLVSVREIVEHLVRISGSRAAAKFGALPDRPLEQVRVADVAGAKSALGWQPTLSLAEGLRRTVEAYRQMLEEEPLHGTR
jgi:nucleoside-diphosphate-sugar epimerase